LALCFLVAFASLGSQVVLLMGEQGLFPIAPIIERNVESPLVGWWEYPTVFWLGASDGALVAGTVVGVTLSLVALLGLWPRVCLGLLALLYLSYVRPHPPFLMFQWDFLLIECGFLALFVPRDRPARWIHLLFLLLVFKLHFESGIAKLVSPTSAWRDGTAMLSYYETTPIPTGLSWYAHWLPAWWHRFETTLIPWAEIVIPFLVFGPRRARLVALVLLGGFHVVGIATANYGFLGLLSLSLLVFLVDDEDLLWAHERTLGRMQAFLRARDFWRSWLTRRKVWRPPPRPEVLSTRQRVLRGAFAILISTYWIGCSLTDAMATLTRSPFWARRAKELEPYYAFYRVANTYPLFVFVPRARIEPEIQTFEEGAWTPRHLRHQPGPLARGSSMLAGHLPRVDYQMWFVGRNADGPLRPEIENLLRRVCTLPESVQPVFADTLPSAAQAVRIQLWRYRHARAEERAQHGAIWRRAHHGWGPALACPSRPGPEKGPEPAGAGRQAR
jgi:hypothetical protein